MKTKTLSPEPPVLKATSAHPPTGDSEKGAAPRQSQEPPSGQPWNSPSAFWQRKTTVIAAFSIVAILSHLVLRFGFHTTPGTYQIPLLVTLALGGLPLLYDLLRKLLKREFGSDLLGGISIITSVLLGEYLAGSIIVLMLAVAILAWAISGEAIRFLAVLVIATPCPLLIAIPISIIGSISLCARRAIIIKSPVVLEQIAECRTAIFDKTGTLTYGEPKLTEQLIAPGFNQKDVLALVASLERYSKHPLARAILAAAKEDGIHLPEASEVSEQPGQGLRGTVSNLELQITSRNKLISQNVAGADQLPPVAGGLECVVAIDDRYAAALRFRDAPRTESRSFVSHLGPKHRFARVMLVSGDRESEVRYLAEQVGITEIYAQKSPEEKLAIVRKETAAAKTLYVGDGINDAPAMMAATVGMAIGQNSDVTAEAAGVVVMDNSLEKVDEFIHISRRMRAIALQSAVGGMALSIIGMTFAATGHLSPVSGAILQEVIDVLAVLNALRAAFPPKVIHDL